MASNPDNRATDARPCSEVTLSKPAADVVSLQHPRIEPIEHEAQLGSVLKHFSAMKRLAVEQPSLKHEMDWVRNLHIGTEDSFARRSPVFTSLLLHKRFCAISRWCSPAVT